VEVAMGVVREFKRSPAPSTPSIEHGKFSKPDETRKFDLGKMEVVSLGGETFTRATFEPGWRWSNCIKPIANTPSCQARHLSLILSGRLHVAMDNGDEYEFGPGEIGEIPPGHDAWVVGNTSVVAIDIAGTMIQGKKK
jgi:hypothetical protein